MSHVSWIDGPATGRRAIDAPPRAVVLLEDRAQVTRRATVEVAAGRNRLLVPSISPIAHDLSLRAEVTRGKARVADVRLRRGLRTERAAKPDAIAALATEVDAALARRQSAVDAARRAVDAHARVGRVVGRGVAELPEDVAWGLGDGARWTATFTALFERGRALVDEAHGHRVDAEEADRLAREARQRQAAADRPDHRLGAFVELDVMADAAGAVDVELVYAVPNAIWRPVHRARLTDDGLRFESRAAVWQRTGEDWVDVEFAASTARTSLGTEPPLLGDDLLTAQRRVEQVTLAAREVEVQTTAPDGAPASGAVELPGVDDGGEVRHLVSPRPVTLMGDGRPVFVELFAFDAPAERGRVLMAEVDPTVHLRVTARHTGTHPVLAGPVELVRDSGTIGWTEVMYVAPGGPFELGFGPDDALRAVRTATAEEETDHVDGWMRRTISLTLYLSNIGPAARPVCITERVPVSEVEQARVEVLADGTTEGATLDENGMWTLERTVPANGHDRVTLRWRLHTAPGVGAPG